MLLQEFIWLSHILVYLFSYVLAYARYKQNKQETVGHKQMQYFKTFTKSPLL